MAYRVLALVAVIAVSPLSISLIEPSDSTPPSDDTIPQTCCIEVAIFEVPVDSIEYLKGKLGVLMYTLGATFAFRNLCAI